MDSEGEGEGGSKARKGETKQTNQKKKKKTSHNKGQEAYSTHGVLVLVCRTGGNGGGWSCKEKKKHDGESGEEEGAREQVGCKASLRSQQHG